MKKLPFGIICLYSLLWGAAPGSARDLALAPATQNNWTGQPEVLSEKVGMNPERQSLLGLSEGEEKKATESDSSSDSDNDEEKSEEPKFKPFDKVIKDAEKQEGLLAIYRNSKTNKNYLEIQPGQLNRNFFCAIALASGIGESGVYRGWPISDFMFQFRRVKDSLQLVVPNSYFRTQPGDPQQRAIDSSFSDSIVAVVRIVSIHPERNSILIDMDELFLGNMPGPASFFPWIVGDSNGSAAGPSYISNAKVFPENVEIESAHTLPGSNYLTTLPNAGAFKLGLRYSLSELPANNGFRPRLADDRIGYFISAYQDLSDSHRSEPFVRYLNRWHLEKQIPSAPLSPPKEPIVFWIENTVPLEYRDAIREGVLMWNKAFEQAGFIDAIEVRQMPDNADWDPADVRYNTIRWSPSFESWATAIGPSRVNPLTGQILDADVIIDGNAVRNMLQEYRNFAEPNASAIAPGLSALAGNPVFCRYRIGRSYLKWLQQQSDFSEGRVGEFPLLARMLAESQHIQNSNLCFGIQSATQSGFGALSLSVRGNALPKSEEMEKYINQFLRWLAAHEVGHTLGLRHNFRGSTMLAPEELNNIEITRSQGLVGSVMDYAPVNLAPPGAEQGDYFSTSVGSYDRWAIEYGYKPIDAISPRGELRELEKIAQRAPEPGLSYAPDEDTFAFLDPQAKAYDLSNDPLRYSQWQMDNAREVWSRLDKRYLGSDERYSDLRDRFNIVFSYYFNHAYSATDYIGGQTFNRHHPDDPGSRLPFEPVPVEKQRQVLALLEDYVFAEDAFDFPPELLNKLAPSRWLHWGSFPNLFRLDYPIYDRIHFLQSMVLIDLFSSQRLDRLRDIELKTAPGEALTLPELFDTLKASVWTEVLDEKKRDSMEISSLRRGLQRQHLNILVNMILRDTDAISNASNMLEFLGAALVADAPEDARVLARYQLRQLQEDVRSSLRRHGKKMDTLTMAHLEDVSDRIAKVLDAQIRSKSNSD